MSDMLEQAIVDAEALKEAALKTAKQEVLEKYSNDVKSAVEQLLEQEEDLDLNLDLDAGMEEDPGMDFDTEEDPEMEPGMEEEAGLKHRTHDSLPYKHRTLQRDPQNVTINLQQLEEQIDKVYNEINNQEESFLLASEDVKDEEIELIEEGEEDERPASEDDEEDPKGPEDLGEDIDNIEKEILEALYLDYKTVPTGHVGAFTESEKEYAIEMEKILAKYEDVQEENKEQRRLMEKAKDVIDVLEENNNKHKSIVKKLRNKLLETNLVNAKLYYSNHALSDTSLNERQKMKIVEALSKADSLKHAKMIFETLKNTVGYPVERQPKSLSEAVEKRSLLTVSPHRKQETATVEEAISSRWKKLAGIK